MKTITTDRCWVGQEHLLSPGRKIQYRATCDDRRFDAVIIERIPGIAFRVKDGDTGRSCEIYIEQIKEIQVEDGEIASQ